VRSSGAGLRLGELVAENRTGLTDERGQYEDWIEVINTGATPVNLSEFALTKDYFDPGNAWHFPSNHWAAPGERVVVFCDEDGKQGPLHASFKLLRSGDRVFLVRTADWTILDSLSFGRLPTDTSFGVLGAGIESQLLAWPTPGEANLPLPPRRGPQPELFWRTATAGSAGGAILTMRWLGSPDAASHVEWSDNLDQWQPAFVAPSNLGEGIFQWTEAGTPAQRFYRVVEP
jgi:hypothetical protein